MKPQNIITGTIKQGDLEVIFVGEDYRFIFIPSQYSPQTTLLNTKVGVLEPENNFIKGQTFSGQWIWICCNEPLSLEPTKILNTWLYIISTSNIADCADGFDSIRFEGGSLNSTFQQKSIRHVFDHEERNKVSLKIEDDTITIPLNNDSTTDLKIFSTVTESSSITNGSSIHNTGAELRLAFQENTQIDDSKHGFIKHYEGIETLISFMTFRQNVYFDHIYLEKKKKFIDYEKPVPYKYAECFIKSPETIDKLRGTVRCITFNELTPDSMAKLYEIIMARDSKKSSYHVNFIPKSSREASKITINQLREVCTSIELEAYLARIHASKESALNKLTTKIKEIIVDSKKHNELTEREYSYIQGNISHWSAPAAELAKKLFDENKESVSYILKFINKDELTEDDMQAVIKVRNSVTHTGAFSFTENEANTLLVMMAVVYSAILKRCGVDPEDIKKIFEKGFITGA